MRPPRKAGARSAPRHGLARVLSKRGLCSRSEAAKWIAEGRVRVEGRVVRDPEFPGVDGAARKAGHHPEQVANPPRHKKAL